MNLNLPPKPSLVQLKKQAKQILKAHVEQDVECLPVVRRLRQFTDLPDAQVFAGELALNDVQLALALYYGYDGWTNLTRHIDNQEAEARPTELLRQDGDVIIRGFEQMDWGGSFFRRQDSYMAVLAACLRAMGVQTSFEQVMGLSGAAFGLTVADGVCPSGGRLDGACYERVHRAYQLAPERIELDEGRNEPAAERLCSAAVAHINRGVPVPYMDGEYSMIVGYKNNPFRYICHVYAGGKGYQEMNFPAGSMSPAWWADILKSTGKAIDDRAAIIESLAAAVAMTQGDDSHGLPAYDKWIGLLEDSSAEVNPHGNAYCYAILLTNRAAAAEYTATLAEQLPGDAGQACGRASVHYRNVSERLLAGRDCVAIPWAESFTPANRAIEAELMRRNQADDAAAIAQIEAVLAHLS